MYFTVYVYLYLEPHNVLASLNPRCELSVDSACLGGLTGRWMDSYLDGHSRAFEHLERTVKQALNIVQTA